MRGIDLNGKISYLHASLRFFNEGEHHVERHCPDDVLLLVYSGVLRFSEDGQEREVYPGCYYIQRANTHQAGTVVSEQPRYLYVHFRAEWSKAGAVLPRQGNFSCAAMMPLLKEMDRLSHSGASKLEREAVFFQILSQLYHGEKALNTANRVAEFMAEHLAEAVTLEQLAAEFHFSKNYLIRLFKKEYNITPFTYINRLRLQQAERLLEVTSKPAEEIAYECGFGEYSHFYKSFRREYGVAPTAWRNRIRLRAKKEKQIRL